MKMSNEKGVEAKVLTVITSNIFVLMALLGLATSLSFYLSTSVFDNNIILSTSLQVGILVACINVVRLPDSAIELPKASVLVASLILAIPNAIMMVVANGTIFDEMGELVGSKRDILFTFATSSIVFVIQLALTVRFATVGADSINSKGVVSDVDNVQTTTQKMLDTIAANKKATTNLKIPTKI